MSLKKIEQVKGGKLFRIWDIIVYVLVVAVSVSLIVFFAVTRDNTELSGIVVTLKGKDVFTYDFIGESYEISSPQNVEITEENGDRIVVHVYDEEGYNDIEIDLNNDSVRVIAADCSYHKDCVYSLPMDSNSSVPIICTPHGLVIRPSEFVDDGIIII